VVARKRDLLFIAIGELHVGLARDIRVIYFCKTIDPNISWKWTGLWARQSRARTNNQSPAQLTIGLTLVPFDGMQQVMIGLTWPIMTQLLQLHREEAGIENFNTILPFVSSKSRIALMT
jgi:hypothetical protein